MPKAAKKPKAAKTAKLTEDEKREMRVQIAKDVIRWVNLGKIKPESQYVHCMANTEEDVLKMKKSDGRKCEVCALGAMMICHVARYDRVNDFWGHREILKHLGEYFTRNQLGTIEVVFEGFARGSKAQEQFYNDHSHDHRGDLLIAIMQNIIDHDGTFRPSVRYDVKKVSA